MAYDYALVHLYYTIPPAVVLTLIYRPLLTYLDVYKILFLITIAVTSTIPWDSYLIRHNVWSYPPDAIVGPTFLDIPAEELFFFVIQTYNTSLLYLLLSKPTFHPAYLCGTETGHELRKRRLAGVCGLLGVLGWGWKLVFARNEGFYMGLILVWATPFILLLWSLAHPFLINLPRSNTIYPIMIPTFYLWIVDTIALRRGTWVIESGTKLGWELWRGLEVEEAFFFFATNCLIVFGLVAFDNALAIMNAFPSEFPTVPSWSSPLQLIRSLLLPLSQYDESRIQGFQEALSRLRRKSRSFYLASGVFQGRLRIDLVLLYSFCRVADDLVDDAGSEDEARHWIRELTRFLDISYGKQRLGNQKTSLNTNEFISRTFPLECQSALRLLPTQHLSPKPLYDLLEGFEMDLAFTGCTKREGGRNWPITDQRTLDLYGERVAGTVAESCIELAYHHSPEDHKAPPESREAVLGAGRRMGVALQYVNIARDIAVDAAIQRVYVPTTWLHEVDDDNGGLTPQDIVQRGNEAKVMLAVEKLRQRLLDRAFEIYAAARPEIEKLPIQARAPMRVAVESYMEIGRVLREKTEGKTLTMKRGRATVPKGRRVRVAWKALRE